MAELVYGRHAVYHLLSAARRRVIRLLVQKGSKGAAAPDSELIQLAHERKIPIQYRDSASLKNFLPGATPQSIVAETESYPYVGVDELLQENLILVLDEIQDPQNLGALCRSAYVFGAKGVLLAQTNAASVSGGTCQAAVGAVEYLKIARASSIAQELERFKKNGFWVYGTDAEATKNVYEESFPEKVVLVIGSEEKGLRRLVRERCDLLVKIPMIGQELGSLNASVSGAIVLYEIKRQQLSRLSQEKY